MAARSSSADRLGSSEVLERAGNVQTRRFELSAPLLPEPRYPFLKKLFADGGYQGPQFRKALAQVLPQASVEIVKRSDTATGFVVLPRRWVVERTLAWLKRCRRLAKDFENLTRTSLVFLRLASIRLMLRKLCNPA